MPEPTHLGKKISRIRELRGMKQETLAEQLGISQQAVSKIEQSGDVEEITLDRIGKVLGISATGIRNFSEEAAINYFNTFNDTSTGAFQNYNCTFNPIEKIVELYDALLKSEKEKVALLERVIEKLEKK